MGWSANITKKIKTKNTHSNEFTLPYFGTNVLYILWTNFVHDQINKFKHGIYFKQLNKINFLSIEKLPIQQECNNTYFSYMALHNLCKIHSS